MLETLLKLYRATMALDIRSPIPHLFGPPGSGKSTVVEQVAELMKVNLHVINVSRISPLELEGVQMPDKQHAKLNLLHNTYWTQLKEGDIVLLDEFLRGFPEVYNGLLDIMTSHTVAGFQLPRVFFVAASNSTVAYDKALEDRLLHIPVPDPRNSKRETKRLATILVEALGLLPAMAEAWEMQSLLEREVFPMFEILDHLTKGVAYGTAQIKGHSLRNLIGQAQLRHVMVPQLKEMIEANNVRAINNSKYQYVLLLNGKNPDPKYVSAAKRIKDNPKLTQVQARNLALNLELIELEEIRKEKNDDDVDDLFA